MFYVNTLFAHQVAVVAIDTNKKSGTQVIEIFQALGHPTGFVPEFIAGTRHKVKTVVRAEVLKNRTPKKYIVFIFYVYRRPALQHFCIHRKTFCCIGKMYLFILIFNTHTKHRKNAKDPATPRTGYYLI